MPAPSKRSARPAVGLVLFLLATGCRQDMHDQPRLKPLGQSDFFADGRASRPQVEGTVARSSLATDEVLATGKSGGVLTPSLPMAVSGALLERGRREYQTFCSPCHGRTGRGDGMVVQRGFKAPSSFHVDRLRQAPVGYLFDVMSNGFGAMSDYAAQVPAADRWAIAAYVRTLQWSHYVHLEELPPERRTAAERALPAAAGAQPSPTGVHP